MTGRLAPGWYPDYEAPPGHQRFWDGERWTERRAAEPSRGATRIAWWVGGGVGALVIAVVAVLVLTGDDEPGSPGPAGSSGPPAASSRPEDASPTADAEPDPDGTEPDPDGTVEVAGALDDATIELADGSLVRLVGVAVDGDCATGELAGLVEGRAVTLTTPGADQDSEGRLLRYVDRDGVDVGLRLIQRGAATASDEANPRRAIYRRVDARSPDVC